MINNLEKMFNQISKDSDYFKSYSGYVSELLASLDVEAVRTVIKCFLEARKNKKTIYFAGNGGSSATASHFAQDLGEVGRKANLEGFKTISLNDNVSLITALANDYGYDKIFSIQIKQIFSLGDVLLVISASGNSPNVVAAVESAKELGGITIGLVGFDGGKLAKICDHVIHVKSQKGEYGPVEDVHMILDHMITSYLILQLRKSEKK